MFKYIRKAFGGGSNREQNPIPGRQRTEASPGGSAGSNAGPSPRSRTKSRKPTLWKTVQQVLRSILKSNCLMFMKTFEDFSPF